MPDLPAISDASEEPGKAVLDPDMPQGISLIHQRIDAPEVWRLCCRLRLDMREDQLSLKDVHQALGMAYPDLKITPKELKTFMEEYVDGAIITSNDFWRKGMMRASAKLNAVVQAAEVAQKMQNIFEEVADEVMDEEPKVDDRGRPMVNPRVRDMKDIMNAGEKVIRARQAQMDMMSRIGMGPPIPQKEKDSEKKSNIMVPIQNVINLDLSEALGGSFARRRATSIPTEGKTEA